MQTIEEMTLRQLPAAILAEIVARGSPTEANGCEEEQVADMGDGTWRIVSGLDPDGEERPLIQPNLITSPAFEPGNDDEDDELFKAYRLLMGVLDETDVDAREHQSSLLNTNNDSTAHQSSKPTINKDNIIDLVRDLQSITIKSNKPQADEDLLSDDELERSTSEAAVRDATLSNPSEFSSISPVPPLQPLSTDTDKNKTTPSNAPVIGDAFARVPENPFSQSAAQFQALRNQLNALIIDADFTSYAPQSAVRALNNLKTQWTLQAFRVFARNNRTTQNNVDVLKRDSLQSLVQVKRELAAQGNLWHRYVRPLLNALISWLAYVESCLGVPHRFQPRLFKATYAEEAFQALQPDDRLREVHDAYDRDMSVAVSA